MEVYKAAELYPEHEKTLYFKTGYHLHEKEVWIVRHFPQQGYYMLFLNDLLFPPGTRFKDDTHAITKQRGGIRKFKTLDSVYSALKQIGQNVIVIEGN